MSNWAFNTIKINGKNEDIEKFLSDASKYEDGTIRFSSWIPVPDTFKKYDTTNFPNGERLEIGKPVPLSGDNAPIVTQELIDEYIAATKLQMEQYGVVGWYDYNCKTYGCKSDSQIEIKSQSDGELMLNCITPWVEPTEFFCTMSERYPKLSFFLSSGSADGVFYSEYLFENGGKTVLKEEVYEVYDDTEDFYKEHPWLRIRNRILFIIYRYKSRIRGFLCKMGLMKEEDDELPFLSI